MTPDGPTETPAKSDPLRKARARELWERLGNSRPGPDNKDLMFLARFVPLLSTAAVKTLLNRSVSISELKELIRHVPKAHDAAVKVMLSRADELTEDDLRLLVTETKSPEIARLLIKRNPGDAVLGFVERTVESMKEYVDGIRKKESTSDVLREIDRLL